jgi:hypothetical protein
MVCLRKAADMFACSGIVNAPTGNATVVGGVGDCGQNMDTVGFVVRSRQVSFLSVPLLPL